MNKPKTPLPKFGDGTTAGPMVTFMRSDSLRSFKTKRQELKGNIDMRALLRKQRMAVQMKAEEDKKKEEAKK